MKSVKSINLCESVVQTSYDIVKSHGGELKMESKESEGSEFIFRLPIFGWAMTVDLTVWTGKRESSSAFTTTPMTREASRTFR